MASSSDHHDSPAAPDAPAAAALQDADPLWLTNAKELAPESVKQFFSQGRAQVQTLVSQSTQNQQQAFENHVTVVASWLERTASNREWTRQQMAGHILEMELWRRYRCGLQRNRKGHKGETDLKKAVAKLQERGLGK